MDDDATASLFASQLTAVSPRNTDFEDSVLSRELPVTPESWTAGQLSAVCEQISPVAWRRGSEVVLSSPNQMNGSSHPGDRSTDVLLTKRTALHPILAENPRPPSPSPPPPPPPPHLTPLPLRLPAADPGPIITAQPSLPQDGSRQTASPAVYRPAAARPPPGGPTAGLEAAEARAAAEKAAAATPWARHGGSRRESDRDADGSPSLLLPAPPVSPPAAAAAAETDGAKSPAAAAAPGMLEVRSDVRSGPVRRASRRSPGSAGAGAAGGGGGGGRGRGGGGGGGLGGWRSQSGGGRDPAGGLPGVG